MLTKTKKVNLIFGTLGEFNLCCKAIDDIGVIVVGTNHNYYRSIYTYYLEATQEQAYKLLDLANEYNGLLTKGEA